MKTTVYKDTEETNEGLKEVELTEEENKKLLLDNEEDILAALMEAADFRDETAEINIKRGGKRILSFRVHALSESEYNECRRRNTKYVRNKGMGAKIPEDVDSARYRAALIHKATVDEDREKLWNNKKAWQQFRVLNGTDLIMLLLKAGEQDEICDAIDKLSGYYSAEDEEETIKN